MNGRERKLPSWLKLNNDKSKLSKGNETEGNLERKADKLEPGKLPRVVEYIMSPKELSDAALQYLKEKE